MSKKQLLSRLAQMLIVLIGISIVTFLLTYISPGDPVRNMYLAQGLMPDEAQVALQREEMGLNDPFLTQYFRWLGNCLHGDFGTSYSLHKPVTDLMLARLWPTIRLSLASLALMLVVAVPLGMAAAVRRGGVIDHLGRRRDALAGVDGLRRVARGEPDEDEGDEADAHQHDQDLAQPPGQPSGVHEPITSVHDEYRSSQPDSCDPARTSCPSDAATARKRTPRQVF